MKKATLLVFGAALAYAMLWADEAPRLEPPMGMPPHPADHRVDATFEEVVEACLAPVKITYVTPKKRKR